MHPISRDDLHLAVEHVTGGQAYGAAAYVDRHSGAILWGGDGLEEPLPDDIDEEELYTRRTYANTPDPLIGEVTMIEDRIVMWTGRCM
jgi:hypothetical protein